MTAPLEVGAFISSMSYGSTGFVKVHAVREVGEHDTSDSSFSEHDPVSFVRLSWRQPQ